MITILVKSLKLFIQCLSNMGAERMDERRIERRETIKSWVGSCLSNFELVQDSTISKRLLELDSTLSQSRIEF